MSDKPESCSTPSNAEPAATRSTVPIWIFALTLVLIYLSAVYFDHHSGWFDPKVYSPYTSAEELESYQPKSGAAAMLARGKQVYEQVCGLCHGPDGLGKPGQAPPLAGSEFVNAKGMQRLAHIPLSGVAGDIKVGGKDWNLSMAAMGAALSDSDLASVLTYIRSSWGNKADAVTADDVAKIRAIVSKSPAAMSGDQLMKMPE
jgi:mono/diheme cytochrome c family protein